MRMRRLLLVAFAVSPGLFLIPDAVARDLTFEDRVKAQEAIERVYYSHLTDAIKPFEEVVPRKVLEDKVRTYLKESLALERFWKTPVTEEMLRRELERMAQRTRMPDRLRELYAALGNDSFLVQECLVRPVVVNRIARNFFAFDRAIHEEARSMGGALRDRLLSGAVSPLADRSGRTLVELIRDDSEEGSRSSLHDEEIPGRTGEPWRQRLAPKDFNERSSGLPERPGEVGPLTEEPERFAISVVLEREPGRIRLARFVVEKIEWDAWWHEVSGSLDEESVQTAGSVGEPLPVAASSCTDGAWDNGILDDIPDPRRGATAVWTGSVMVAWGGYAYGYYNSGGRYDPALDDWSPTSTVGAPSPRGIHTAVWTGTRMVIWGGSDGNAYRFNTGGRYDPVSDTWTPTATTNAPPGVDQHTAVWTGSRMIVWGGWNAPGGYMNTGGVYDPATDTWVLTSAVNAPSPRSGHSAVWTGSRMIVWGGSAGVFPYLNSGGRYDPATNTWLNTSTVNAPSNRYHHSAVWTGSVMVVWGGHSMDADLTTSTGGRYDPGADTWLPTSTTFAPVGRVSHSAVWTGSAMVVWGGSNDSNTVFPSSGGRYDPVADLWAPMATTNAPSPRSGHATAWTGSLMIVWGGYDDSSIERYINTGARYDPSTDSWTPTAASKSISVRTNHTAVWTGSHMVVWGGNDGTNPSLQTGGRYDPALDVWTPTSLSSVPTGRYYHTAVWTGGKMIVWGGTNVPFDSSGGAYEPLSDTWTPMSASGAPEARFHHAAVWTGKVMIVWGGENYVSRLNSGGRYDPATNTWLPTSLVNPPSPRTLHTGVFAGGRLVVWGGSNAGVLLNTGGSYDPNSDQWSPTSLVNSPSARDQHTAVSTTQGTMIVWGGYGTGGTGGRYDPKIDTWTATSVAGAPPSGSGHKAVWTGSEMIVWGGTDGVTYFPGGGRYDPKADHWSPVTIAGAPEGRIGHTVVWTGDTMIVWGGGIYSNIYLNSGGRYCGCAGPISTYHRDADGDGFGDAAVSFASCAAPSGYVANALDCSDADALVWSPPGAVGNLTVSTANPTAVTWDDLGALVGPETTYDMVSVPLISGAGMSFAGAACLQSSGGAGAYDARPDPGVGSGYWYLPRGRNSCGVGTYGTSQRDASILACP